MFLSCGYVHAFHCFLLLLLLGGGGNSKTYDLVQSIRKDYGRSLVNLVTDQLGLSDLNGWRCH